MPKIPANKWEHEYDDLRLGGYQLSLDQSPLAQQPEPSGSKKLTKSYLEKLEKTQKWCT